MAIEDAEGLILEDAVPGMMREPSLKNEAY
jgi:hypothetical protein